MHVLIIPSWYPLNEYDLNGCFFREQALAMSRGGVKVGVIAPQFRSLRGGRQAIFNRYGREIWKDQDVWIYLEHNIFWFPKIPYIDLIRWTNVALKLFTQYIKDNGKPDLIHVQSALLAGPAALKIFKKYGIPYCVTEHSTTFGRGLVKPWQFQYLKKVQNSSKKCLAVSKDFSKTLEVKLGKSWEYCPNLLDNIFAEDFSLNLLKNKKDLQFCAVAHLQPKKGFDILIKAFSKVVESYPEASLLIGGDGPEREKLGVLIKELNLDANIELLGALNRIQVRNLMRDSKYFVLSSHIETFGVVVIEALSQGAAVVATKCGGPESIVQPDDGVLVPVNDIESLSAAMLNIIKQNKDPVLIRKNCVERFSEPVFVGRLLKHYNDTIK